MYASKKNIAGFWDNAFLMLLSLLVLSSCNQQEKIDSLASSGGGTTTTTTTSNDDDTEEEEEEDTSEIDKVVKIIAQGAGSASEIGAESVDITGTLGLRAALHNASTGDYIEDVSVQWSAVGGGFNSNDFNGATSDSASITFDPVRTGSTIVQASYVGSDTTIIGPVDTTGTITVSSSLSPDIIQRSAGNAQTDAVNTVLGTALKVRVITNTAVPVPGVGINFTAVLGGGTVVTAQPVLTDADGYAESLVQLSTTPGAHTFRATVTSDSSVNIDFSATANPGTPDNLVFSTQPAGATEDEYFLTQPVVQVKDAYNNTVTSATTSVTLSVGTGSGSLTGTTTKSANSGIVTFTDIAYTEDEDDITIVASATGLSSATSSSFDVDGLLGACENSGAGWQTAGGGCQDTATGLIWGTKSSISYTWHEAVWDASVGTATDASDYDRTNDYEPGEGCYGTCDDSSTDYCKNLSLNSYTDWRLPSLSELATAFDNGAANELDTVTSTNLWTSSTALDHTEAKVIDLSDGTESTADKDSLLRVYCVRGGWSDAARVSIVDWSPWVKTNQKYHAIKARILDGDGNRVNASGVSVGVTSDTGVTGGTASGTTDNVGEVILSDWTISNIGSQIITLSSSGLLSATKTIEGKASYSHDCATDDTRFASADGGCKDLSSGLVWSQSSGGSIDWYNFIWGSELSGNEAPDDADDGRTNDYVSGRVPSSYSDPSVTNYCHSLSEGGHTDWRAPTYQEMAQVGSDWATSYFDLSVTLNSWFYTSSTLQGWGGDNRRAWIVQLDDGSNSTSYKWDAKNAVCVRESAGMVSYPVSHECQIDDANFTTEEGGCRDLGTGLVWSYPTDTPIRWFELVWDSTIADAPQPDVYDQGRINDYTSGAKPSSYTASAVDAYCHELIEGGYRDWRVPTQSELLAVAGAGIAGTYFQNIDTKYFYSSGTFAGDIRRAYIVRLSDGSNSTSYKWDVRHAVCVRNP